MSSNKIIEQQLAEVRDANLNYFDPSTNTYHIPKKRTLQIKEGKCYKVFIKPSYKLNTTVIENWNAGSVPNYSYYKVEITKVMGTKVKIDGVAFDPLQGTDYSDFWSGWIDTADLEIVTEI